jgi:peptidoglycan/LPS O-acetylase OafA/YrhL
VSPPQASPTQRAFRVPSLDGIRGVSFLLVFAAHAGLERFVPGGFGVTVFFFLSGYLITTLLRMEDDGRGKVSLRQFYLRRALRILPPFYLVLGLAVVAARVGVLAGGVGGHALAIQALHLVNYWIVRHGYEGLPSGTGVYWSLAVEEHFYVVFPCLFLILRGLVRVRRRQAMILWALCAVVLAWRCVLVYGQHTAPDRTYVASDTRVDSILFGCALALASNPMLDPASRVSEAGWKWGLLPVSIFTLLATFVCRDPAFRETFRYSLQGIALSPVFIVAVRYPGWGPFRVLNLRAMSFLGVLSYPLYLVHHVVLGAFVHAPFGLGAVRALLAFALSLALAWAIHELVEKPCAQLRRRLSGAVIVVPCKSADRCLPGPLEARGQ